MGLGHKAKGGEGAGVGDRKVGADHELPLDDDTGPGALFKVH